MIIDELIFDRTAADVERVNELKRKIVSYAGIASLTPEELAEYMGGMKGAYNYTDLNRVGQAVAYLAPLVAALPGEIDAYRISKGVLMTESIDIGYTAADVVVNPKTDWAVTDTPTLTQMMSYIEDVHVLEDCLHPFLPPDNPYPPMHAQGLDWVGANAIEKTLYNCYWIIPVVRSQMFERIDSLALSYIYSGEIYSGEM